MRWIALPIVFLTLVLRLEGQEHLSISYATHAQSAGDPSSNLYQGKYNRARSSMNFILREMAPADDGVLDFKDIARARDSRPNVFTTIDRIVVSDLGPENLDKYCDLLNSMAIYYHTVGQLRLSDILFTRVLKLREGQVGKTNPLYVAILHNIANLRLEQGRFDAAENIFNYVLNYYLKVKGKNSLQYIVTLNNSSVLDFRLGRIDDARTGYQQALEILKSTNLLEGSIEEERIMINLALLELRSSPEKAIDILASVKSSLEEKGYEDHPDYNDVIVFLGQIHLGLGEGQAFVPELEKATEKIRRKYGDNTPFYANILELIADQSIVSGNYQHALKQFSEVLEIRKQSLSDRHPLYLRSLAKMAKAQSLAGDAQKALSIFREVMSTYLELTEMFFPNMSESEQSMFWSTFRTNIDLFYEYALENKGLPGVPELVLEIQANTKGMLLNNSKKVKEKILSGTDQELIMKFRQWQSLREDLAGYYSMDTELLKEENIDLNALEEMTEEIERELVRSSSLFSNSLKLTQVGTGTIQQGLGAGELAVEIIRFTHFMGKNGGNSHYLAVILDSEKDPVLIDLSGENDLEGRAFKYYINTIKARITDEVPYANFWKPMEGFTKGVASIFVSPDGIYNNISLSGLRTSNGFLGDQTRITLVSNLRNIVSDGSKGIGDGSKFLLVGNPDYGNPQTVAPLPGTQVEVDRIEKILSDHGFSLEKFTGQDATEMILKNTDHPEVLHIATHGYFVESDASEQLSRSMGISGAVQNQPLMQSGLMLAGSALTLEGKTSNGKENGLLTAYEALNMDLGGTRLVILSACETGLGEIVDGEGVYGLSRSLKVAGAGSVIMSLWKVDDDATQLLMGEFYENWLSTGKLEDSFLSAQQMVRQKYPEPYYWAPFVLSR